MKINKLSSVVLAGIITMGLVGCSSSPPNPIQNPSGFLPDYNLLKPVPNAPENTQIYTYKNPAVQRGDYQAVIVAPVVLYQTATEKSITAQQIQAAQNDIQQGIEQIVSQKIGLADAPGPGVATLKVAITGAQVDSEGFKPWNIVPISAAIKLASTATGTDSKTPVMVIELKFVDSLSGELLRETVTVISGPSFRTADTGTQFDQLAQTWVQQALQYSVDNN